MFKLRSTMEDVAEKLFGRFLPHVEAQAQDDCGEWNIIIGQCCPEPWGNRTWRSCPWGEVQYGCNPGPHCIM
jgi:hypothetical protein